MSEGEQDRSVGLVALADQDLGSFEHRHKRLFHVQGAASPDVPVSEPAGKRRVAPVAKSFRVRWYNIHVRREQDRLQSRIFAFPAI